MRQKPSLPDSGSSPGPRGFQDTPKPGSLYPPRSVSPRQFLGVFRSGQPWLSCCPSDRQFSAGPARWLPSQEGGPGSGVGCGEATGPASLPLCILLCLPVFPTVKLQADHNNGAAEGLTRVCGPRSHCIPAATGPGATLKDPALALMHFTIGRFQLFLKTQG